MPSRAHGPKPCASAVPPLPRLLRIVAQRHPELFLDMDGLGRYSCYALEILACQGPATLNALAAELHLEKSTASRIIDAIERRGYARRRVNPRDRRAVLLEIRPKGQDLCSRIRAELIEEEKGLLQGFEPEVRGAAVRLVARLAQAAVAGDDRPRCSP